MPPPDSDTDQGRLLDERGDPLQIAIDGQAATGKTTVGQAIATRLRILFLDTGVIYRSICLFALQCGIDIRSEEKCALIARSIELHLLPPTLQDGRAATILLGADDITWDIRSPAVDHLVSHMSHFPAVREAVRIRQYKIASATSIVMVGRDIANVVLPNAQVKVMLTATVEERARRRYQEMQARGTIEGHSLAQLQAEITARDQLDAHKLHLMPDTHVIATDDKPVNHIAAQIIKLALDVVDPDGITETLPRAHMATQKIERTAR